MTTTTSEYERGLRDGLEGRDPSCSWFEKPRRSTATTDERLYLDGFNAGRHERNRIAEPFDVQADWEERA